MRKSANIRKNNKVDDEIKINSYFKIVGIIIIILALFTLLTMFITRDKDKTPEEVSIQYSKIIVGSILNRGEEDYYVLVEAKDDDNVSSYESLISTYNNKAEHLRIYTVDLSDDFNKNYIAEKSNLNVDNINDIRFSETTLLHIQNGKIVSTRIGEDITSYLEKISA